MTGGAKKLFVAASFAAAGCTAATNGVEVRQIANPSSKLRQGADGLADARGQLAIGNTGLALEGFRKVARHYPDSAEAYAGMAACYEAMGRFDLAEAKYEAALAFAPRNPALLAALAGTLDRLGRADGAAEVRAEIAQQNSAAMALDQTAADDGPAAAAVNLPAARTVTVPLPAPQIAARVTVTVAGAPLAPHAISVRPAAEQVDVRLPAPRLADPVTVSVHSQVLALRGPSLSEPAPLRLDFSPGIPAPKLGQEASVALGSTPLPMRSASLADNAQLNLDLSTEIAAPRLGQRAAVDVHAARAPRLERMSPGEVALVTGGGPVWRTEVVARTPQQLTVRWVPLATAAARPSIRLLNAARWQGLAARSRSYLADRGWRKIQIGDAKFARTQSLVLYPAGRHVMGRRLAAQFGCRAQPVKGADVFLVLLGRDAALRPAKLRG
ncbi:MAG: LytR C-terminal domain-containing protein [Sphingomicrobium sp.]